MSIFGSLVVHIDCSVSIIHPTHNIFIILSLLSLLLLLRFNPGSTLKIHSAALGDVASLVAVNTTLGAAAG